MADDAADCFALFDPKKTGSISAQDAGIALRTLGKPPSEEDLQEMFGGSPVTFEKFRGALGKLAVPSVEEVFEAAAVFDTYNNGYIAVGELRNVMKNLGEGLDDATLEAMIKVAEPDSEQQVNIRFFVNVLMADMDK